MGYSTMMIFLVPLSKRCTGGRTIGEIFSSIKVRDVNIPDILLVFEKKYYCVYDCILYREYHLSKKT